MRWTVCEVAGSRRVGGPHSRPRTGAERYEMRQSFKTRVARLEGQDEQGRQQARVIRLGLNGLPEDPADLDYGGYAIYLPRKAASAEEWVDQVARRFQARLRDGGDTNG